MANSLFNRIALILTGHASERRTRKVAYAKHLTNVAQSRLYQLPTELLLEIFGILEGADRLSLGASCRHLRTTLTTETKTGLHLLSCRVEFLQRLKKDRYLVLANAEISKQAQSKRKLLCSSCLESHPNSVFRADAVSESPYIRVCPGSRRKLRLCKHTSITIAEFHNAVNATLDRNGPVFICHHPDWTSPALSATLLTERLPPTRREWTLLQISAPFNITNAYYPTRYQLCSGLLALDEYICPHHRSSDSTVYNALYASMLETQGQTVYGSSMTHILGRGTCENKHCDTDFWVQRETSSISTQVCLEVYRSLGRVVDPNAKSWIAQTEAV
jgi:hypothetical protein